MNGISAIPSAMQSATATIQRSTNAVARDAAVVAQQGVASKETIHALIDSRQQVLYTSAAAKLISASDQMQQSIIAVLA
jgi:hypothetical protein